MAKLTREQLNRWNAQAQNGFILDLQYFLIWGEKTLIKDIEQENGVIIRFKLSYIDEFETKINEHGCRWNERTGKQLPVMRIDKLLPCETTSMYRVITIAKSKQMADAEKTKKFATLCKLSAMIDVDAELQAIA